MSKPLTKFGVSTAYRDGVWVVSVRNRIHSRHKTYAAAERVWATLTRTLPAYRG